MKIFPSLAALGLLAAALSACASIDRATIADRLEKFGLSRDRAVCMSEELDDRLDDKQLSQFARFVSRLEAAETVLEARRSLRQIDDPQIARAVTASFFSCAV